jgi:putative FmdB family regulatory protein
MPIYEYQCEACGHRLEAIQKHSDPVLEDCPVCGKSKLKKLLSAAGFQLKGSGWYATDFKGGDKKKDKSDSGSGPEKKGKSESDSGSGTKSGGGCGGGTCGGCAH